MRVLLDQGLPAFAAQTLRETGWDAWQVREIGMRDATGQSILNKAAEEDRFCVTLDKDFHEVPAATGAKKPSVVLLRRQELRAGSLTTLLSDVWERHHADLQTGSAITVTERAIRVRALPLGPTIAPGKPLIE